MVGRRKHEFGISDLEATFPELHQRRWTREVMQQMPVDVEKCPPLAAIGNNVTLPNLVEKRLLHGRYSRLPWCLTGDRASLVPKIRCSGIGLQKFRAQLAPLVRAELAKSFVDGQRRRGRRR